MTATQIKGRLAIAGYQVKDLAEELRVTPSAVSQVINGHSTSHPIMLAIAAKIKRAPKNVFPAKAHLFVTNLTRLSVSGQRTPREISR
jgi:predicted transcriptional regulator